MAKNWFRVALFSVVSIGLAAGFAQAQAVGTPLDLGTLGGASSTATAINSSGQVVGFSNLADESKQHPFIWDLQHGMKDLGTLVPGLDQAAATAINESGDVVGWSEVADGSHAFFWDSKKKTMKDLGTLGGSSSTATGVNKKGDVVGSASTAGDAATRPFLWDGKKMRELPTLGGDYATAWAINDAGEIAGESQLADGSTHGVMWDNKGKIFDLGTIVGNTYSYAYAINADAQVAGYSYANGDANSHPVRWTNRQILDTGVLSGGDGYAFAITDFGQTAGTASMSDGNWYPFVFDAFGMRAYGTLGGSYTEALGMNSAGQVVGDSYTPGDAERHAILINTLPSITVQLNNLLNMVTPVDDHGGPNLVKKVQDAQKEAQKHLADGKLESVGGHLNALLNELRSKKVAKSIPSPTIDQLILATQQALATVGRDSH